MKVYEILNLQTKEMNYFEADVTLFIDLQIVYF